MSNVAKLNTRLTAAIALVAKLQEEIKAATKPVPVKGDEVSFLFGRGDNKVTLVGSVLKVGDGDNGVSYVTVLVEIDGEPTTKRVPLKDVTLTGATETPPPAPDSENVAFIGGADVEVGVTPNAADPLADLHTSNVDALLAE